ncbi:ABC transporter substrate-binding protein [Cohnella terricola]|uniref:Extracellular solute-binding protein n=1 Tax=Cohnella terricola TaxID=1289167 RepID=A0A559JL08_9BACL|nr:extracellular solute-binding protein [Cohnella terricola]TVY00563.1 extracellular solute-binding protein [Cohnella terricola]
MARRKMALVFLLLSIMVLLLSPWADAPSPSSPLIAVQPEEMVAIEPEIVAETSYLKIEAALDEEQFYSLANQNNDFMFRHPDIKIELKRLDPDRAYEVYKLASELEDAADVMLLSNEWVTEFASSGFLLPANAAFTGKSLSEQFEALLAPLKWNDYLWGVPRDMDPYVLVWNRDLLRQWLGDNVELPLTLEQWSTVAEASELSQGEKSWLAIDRNDPLALSAWLDNAANEPSEPLWKRDRKSWTGTSLERAMELLEQQRANLRLSDDGAEAMRMLESGTVLAAVVPYSIAEELEASEQSATGAELTIDYRFWALPFIWPRGSSYVISSHTKAEEAASAWIADMTGDQAQLTNLAENNKLPVYRSLYDSDRQLSNLLSGRNGDSFPNRAPVVSGPNMAERLGVDGELWRKLAIGAMSTADWEKQWFGDSDH